eukprot:Amastigsp_a341890_33.p4 type:complete len:117 gc:universal Amastigsp_a341890_33:308-658(+)
MVASPIAMTTASHALCGSGKALSDFSSMYSGLFSGSGTVLTTLETTRVAGDGSEIAKIMAPRLTKVLRKSPIEWPWTNLYSSRQTTPVIIAVAVAMAGMMRPAASFALRKSTSWMV